MLFYDCSMCAYCYEHVVTGDRTMIRNAKLRALVAKGPSHREQNARKSISAYKHKREGVDLRVLNEWECKVNECADKRIAYPVTLQKTSIGESGMSSNPDGV